MKAFLHELSKLGWIEGKNFTIDYRFEEQKSERLPELAAELVRLKVDLIVVTAVAAASAAKSATTTIPIVMTNPGDPVGAGLVASLARPGGNVTGFASLEAELSTKRLEILKDAVPKLTRVGFLMTRAAAPHLKRQDQGRVVNIAGLPGLRPEGSSIALAVSKAGLIHLTRCLAVALAPSITVNCVVPGLMEGTRMFARVPPDRVAATKDKALLKRTTSLEDVSRQVLLFCQSDSTTGQAQVIDAGTVFH